MSKSPLYTRSGDRGTTSLVGGTRVAKHHARLEAYGTIDELKSHIGLLASAAGLDDHDRHAIATIQHRLFDAGTILATEPESAWQPAPMPESAVEALESEIDRLDSALPRLRQFILPGGHPDAARAQVARTVARRAERRMTALAAEGTEVSPVVMRFVNRLSDYLFALARTINVRTSTPEVLWEPLPCE
ncbi:MAG: cob(I)yrinic acid a,c-diamide adenosyltransferase [Muribaculaceae bacterium]|nr:cob(I)yrinic acid a,c-diamide adenosyltransferase [Muribaculaceae bacterium]